MNDALTVDDLLADPVRFDGQRVRVTGWFVPQKEHSALYASPADARAHPRPGVWWVHPETLGGPKAVAALSGNRVRVVGVFANRRTSGCGHFGAWPAQLSALSELEPAADGEAAPRPPGGAA